MAYRAGGTCHALDILQALNPVLGDRLFPAPVHIPCDQTHTLLDQIMGHLWTNAHLPTPEMLIRQVTDNPERALQASQHIHRTVYTITVNLLHLCMCNNATKLPILHQYICTHTHPNPGVK